MTRNGLRFLPCLALLVALAALALPATASAHQRVTVKNGELIIEGDFFKRTDEITITYDSVNDRYVITHDIEDLESIEECERDGVEPVHIVYCKAKGVKRIRILAGEDADKVNISGLILNDPVFGLSLFLPKELTDIEIDTGNGNDKVEVGPPVGCSDCGTNPAVIQINTGAGIDSVTLNAGNNTVTSGGSAKLAAAGGTNQVAIAGGGSALTLSGGANSITVGAGNSKATVTGGDNTVVFGAGASTFTASGGDNTVTFGAGNSVFFGGAGIDTVLFGAGNNTFSGGFGADSVKLGPGKDDAKGGPGTDSLAGGKSNDRLVGGPGKDTLNGGPGAKDQCLSGEIFQACEAPCEATSDCDQQRDSCRGRNECHEPCRRDACKRPGRAALSWLPE